MQAEDVVLDTTKGDCFYFSGEERHEVSSPGEEQTEAPVVIASDRTGVTPA